MGQILLAMRMGKTRIIAETGAGQHGVATATVCARFGLPCVVYMGAVDVERQKPNVFRMNLLGAEVRPVTSGSATLKDAMNEALRDWVTNVARHLLPDRLGRRPAPLSGDGARLPVGDRRARPASRCWRPRAGCRTRWSPASAAAPTPSACSTPSSTTRACSSIGVEAAGEGLDTDRHAAAINGGRPGRAARQQDLSAAGRATARSSRPTRSPPASTIPASAPSTPGCTTSAAPTYLTATDDEALDAFQLCARAGGHPAGPGVRPRPRPPGRGRPRTSARTGSWC